MRRESATFPQAWNAKGYCLPDGWRTILTFDKLKGRGSIDKVVGCFFVGNDLFPRFLRRSAPPCMGGAAATPACKVLVFTALGKLPASYMNTTLCPSDISGRTRVERSNMFNGVSTCISMKCGPAPRHWASKVSEKCAERTLSFRFSGRRTIRLVSVPGSANPVLMRIAAGGRIV